MSYTERITKENAPESVVRLVKALETVRAGVLLIEAVLDLGPASGLSDKEFKRLDKVVTVVKVGMKIGKKALRDYDPLKNKEPAK